MAGDDQGLRVTELLPVTTGDYESYQQHFMTPFSSLYRNLSDQIKETRAYLGEINKCRIYPIIYG